LTIPPHPSSRPPPAARTIPPHPFGRDPTIPYPVKRSNPGGRRVRQGLNFLPRPSPGFGTSAWYSIMTLLEGVSRYALGLCGDPSRLGIKVSSAAAQRSDNHTSTEDPALPHGAPRYLQTLCASAVPASLLRDAHSSALSVLVGETRAQRAKRCEEGGRVRCEGRLEHNRWESYAYVTWQRCVRAKSMPPALTAM